MDAGLAESLPAGEPAGASVGGLWPPALGSGAGQLPSPLSPCALRAPGGAAELAAIPEEHAPEDDQRVGPEVEMRSLGLFGDAPPMRGPPHVQAAAIDKRIPGLNLFAGAAQRPHDHTPPDEVMPGLGLFGESPLPDADAPPWARAGDPPPDPPPPPFEFGLLMGSIPLPASVSRSSSAETATPENTRVRAPDLVLFAADSSPPPSRFDDARANADAGVDASADVLLRPPLPWALAIPQGGESPRASRRPPTGAGLQSPASRWSPDSDSPEADPTVDGGAWPEPTALLPELDDAGWAPAPAPSPRPALHALLPDTDDAMDTDAFRPWSASSRTSTGSALDSPELRTPASALLPPLEPDMCAAPSSRRACLSLLPEEDEMMDSAAFQPWSSRSSTRSTLDSPTLVRVRARVGEQWEQRGRRVDVARAALDAAPARARAARVRRW
jgi:hypothetical protein